MKNLSFKIQKAKQNFQKKKKKLFHKFLLYTIGYPIVFPYEKVRKFVHQKKRKRDIQNPEKIIKKTIQIILSSLQKDILHYQEAGIYSYINDLEWDEQLFSYFRRYHYSNKKKAYWFTLLKEKMSNDIKNGKSKEVWCEEYLKKLYLAATNYFPNDKYVVTHKHYKKGELSIGLNETYYLEIKEITKK